jgi:tRNA (guanine37-N1)-methyltransferase
MRIEVVTLFPALVEAGLSAGVLGRAVSTGKVEIGLENPRSHADDPRRTVDERPFGGGPGMVLKAEPLALAIAAAKGRLPAGAPVIGLSAHGTPFDQARARGLAERPGFALVAGRYEGIDQRVSDALIDAELSIGDYVLSGGELPALVVIDAVARLLPGVLGDEASAAEESFGDGLLDWPQYTRPEVWQGRPVPPVLLGGNHAAIRRWRLMQALGRTWQKRPDLLARRPLSPEERALLEEYCSAAGVEPPR